MAKNIEIKTESIKDIRKRDLYYLILGENQVTQVIINITLQKFEQINKLLEDEMDQ